MKKQLLFAFGAAALLASCSNDIDSPVANVKDGYLKVNGTINEVKTRATDTNFEEGDEIGVSGGTFSNVNYSFTSNAFTSETGIKLSDSSTSFTAYYPFQATLTEGKVNFTVVGEVGNIPVRTEESDFMFAEAQQASNDFPDVTFTFNHKMSKLGLTIVDKTEGELADATISLKLTNVATSGTFDTTNGTVTPGTANGTIELGTVTSGTQKTVIVPSYVSENQNPINVVVTVAFPEKNVTYLGSVTPTLVAGTQYNYTLNIKKSGSVEPENGDLEIESCEINGWEGSQSNEESDLAKDKEPNVLEVGDFLLKDGTVIDKNDEDFASLKSQIVGVVYYVRGQEGPDVSNFGYEIKNGLALAIDNAGKARWGSGNTDYSAWGKEGGHPENLGALNISEMNVGSNGPKYDQIMGYNNTAVIKKAQQDFMDDDAADEESKDKGYTHSQELLTLLENANKTSVTGASEWYLPNFSEYYIISENLSTINAAIKLANGTELTPLEEDFVNTTKDGAVLTPEGYYWTSTLRGSSNGWVSLLDNSDTEAFKNWSITRNSNSTKGYFRFAVAF